MKIGVPKEIKVLEGRVALTPYACAELIQQGHEVFLEATAGELSGYQNADYVAQGVVIKPSAAELYASASLIVKVKEPVADDLQYLHKNHILFCYLHLAANRILTEKLCEIGLTALAFETVTDEAGHLPLLKPMSEIAGTLAIQVGTHLLHQPQGGKGIMLGGLALIESSDINSSSNDSLLADQSVIDPHIRDPHIIDPHIIDKGTVVILGAGIAGSAAAVQAAACGAQVILVDREASRYKKLCDAYPNIEGVLSTESTIAQLVKRADLLIGAVLLPGLKAPKLVSESQVQTMQAGSVIIDISVDQGGCIETIRPTNYQQPTYLKHEVLHFGVSNMPGAVPRTASQALSAVILPYVKCLSEEGWEQYGGLRNGLNVRKGHIDNALIASALKS